MCTLSQSDRAGRKMLGAQAWNCMRRKISCYTAQVQYSTVEYWWPAMQARERSTNTAAMGGRHLARCILPASYSALPGTLSPIQTACPASLRPPPIPSWLVIVRQRCMFWCPRYPEFNQPTRRTLALLPPAADTGNELIAARGSTDIIFKNLQLLCAASSQIIDCPI